MANELMRETESGFLPLGVSGEVALEAVRYDSLTGLVPVVVQDASTGHVLMLAYANREALKRTYGTGQAWFWSRSRKSLWHKGETSGNVQTVVEVRIDCDGDTVLYLVNPVGPACHTGEVSCFYRRMTRNGANEVPASAAAHGDEGRGAGASPALSQPVDDLAGDERPAGEVPAGDLTGNDLTAELRADELPAGGLGLGELGALWRVVTDRWENRPQGSYTTYLFEQGVDKSAKKVGEEAVEVVLAAKNAMSTMSTSDSGKSELASESADLVYHLMVLWKACGLEPKDVMEVLANRQ